MNSRILPTDDNSNCLVVSHSMDLLELLDSTIDLAMQDGQEESHLMLACRESSRLLYLCVCHHVLGLTLGQY